jgi:hypothetical protein
MISEKDEDAKEGQHLALYITMVAESKCNCKYISLPGFSAT